MKKLVLVTLLLASAFAKAQAPDYDDLRILYADGNYEKLVKVSEGYTMKEDHAKEALPFFWLGKGLYKISVTGNSDERYKNAYKEAINALGKAIKNDKDKSVQEANDEFFEEFKMTLVERIQNDLDSDKPDFKKASAWIIKYYKMDVNSIGAKYLEAASKYYNADKGGAVTAWKDADMKLDLLINPPTVTDPKKPNKIEYEDISKWAESDKEMLKMGVMYTADAYVALKQADKAKVLLGKVKQWYEDDEDFMAKYDEIVN